MQWRLAAAAAACGAVVVMLWVGSPPPDQDADADYRLALTVVADYDRGMPTDAWLEQAPVAPLSGLPDLPSVAYPLMPEETFL